MTHPLRAVVLDTNSISRGEPNLKVFRSLAASCAEHDVQLWVPQVVVWELAEHVLAAVRVIHEAMAAHSRARLKWGIDPLEEPDPVEADMIVDLIERVGIVIVPVDGDSAIAAIRDQVLRTGVGAGKKGVKTGAADSAWLRSVHAYNDGTFDGLILVSADNGVLRAARELSVNSPPRSAANLEELRRLLDDDQQPASPERAEAFLAAVQAKIESAEDLYYLADLGRRNWWNPGLLDSDFHAEWEQQETDVAAVRAVESAGPAVYDAWSDAVTGHVRVSVSVEEQYARQDASGDSPEYLFVTYDGSVVAEVTVYLNSWRDFEATMDDDFVVVEFAVVDDTLDRRSF